MEARMIFGITLGLALGLLPVTPAYAGNSSAGTKIGVLDCRTVPNTTVSLLIHSTVGIACEYRASDNSGVEHYIGETGIGLGIDVSFDRRERLVYTVLAAEFKSGRNKLAGKYFGASASATVGAGMGAQVLIGGNNNSISLEPAIEGSTGLGAAAGISYLFLQPASE